MSNVLLGTNTKLFIGIPEEECVSSDEITVSVDGSLKCWHLISDTAELPQ